MQVCCLQLRITVVSEQPKQRLYPQEQGFEWSERLGLKGWGNGWHFAFSLLSRCGYVCGHFFF